MILRSGTEVCFANRRSARQHAPHLPIRPRDQQPTKFTLKANSTKAKSSKPDETSKRARNARYRQQAYAYQRATGDSAKVLREKRLWLHAEYLAYRISGKDFRELRDLYSKRNIRKPKNRLPKARGLSNTAKSARERLDEVFSQRLDANHSASTMGVSSGHVSVDAAIGQTADDGAANVDPLTKATDRVAGEGVKPEADTGTEDESPSTGDYVDHANHANTAAANDAAARQRLRELGIEVADYSTANLAAGGDMDDEKEVEIKEEEADE